jgi:hypothetical protein
MADIIDDMEASLLMSIESAAKLRQKNPEHPLLKFSQEEFGKADAERIKELNTEMLTRFWKRTDSPSSQSTAYVTAVVFLNYHLEMEEALNAA